MKDKVPGPEKDVFFRTRKTQDNKTLTLGGMLWTQ